MGKARENNEDNLFADGIAAPAEHIGRPFLLDASGAAPMLLAVFDGMGGEDRGELASSIAVQKLAEHQDKIKAAGENEIADVLKNYADDTDEEIKTYNKRSGTTAALAVIGNDGVYCFNIGDSRIYYVKNGKLTRVTHDHTVGAEFARSANLSDTPPENGRRSNKLTRCLGIAYCHDWEGYPVIKGKCRILICSDGLTDMLSDSEIEEILSETEIVSRAADNLLQTALNHGGRDNITIIAADVIPDNVFGKLFKKRR